MKSKTLAVWLAVVAGALGVHRLYVYGARDVLAWLHLPPTLAGLAGLVRINTVGQDDRIAWMLLPLLALMIVQGMLWAIVQGLKPDARWDAQHHGGQALSHSGWAVVIGVVVALLVGTTVLMAAVAYGGQKFFEWQIAQQRSAQVLKP